MLKKVVAMSFCAAAFVGVMTGPALAGEITGSGKGGPNGNGTPGATQNGNASFCAFSGLEDNNPPPAVPSKTQNFGHPGDEIFANMIVTRGASAVGIPQPDGSILLLGCNKNLNFTVIPAP
jgi:hypothetical protein